MSYYIIISTLIEIVIYYFIWMWSTQVSNVYIIWMSYRNLTFELINLYITWMSHRNWTLELINYVWLLGIEFKLKVYIYSLYIYPFFLTLPPINDSIRLIMRILVCCISLSFSITGNVLKQMMVGTSYKFNQREYLIST